MSNKSNDRIPKDELILAELIAGASAKGLKGCRYYEYRGLKEDDARETAKGAKYCCALGAAKLVGCKIPKSNFLTCGNDTGAGGGAGIDFLSKVEEQAWNIGAAFNLAMDPDNEI